MEVQGKVQVEIGVKVRVEVQGKTLVFLCLIGMERCMGKKYKAKTILPNMSKIWGFLLQENRIPYIELTKFEKFICFLI